MAAAGFIDEEEGLEVGIMYFLLGVGTEGESNRAEPELLTGSEIIGLGFKDRLFDGFFTFTCVKDIYNVLKSKTIVRPIRADRIF